MTLPDNWKTNYADEDEGMYLFEYQQFPFYVSVLPNYRVTNGNSSNTHIVETILPVSEPNTQIIFKSFTEASNSHSVLSYIQDEIFPEHPPRQNTITTFANCNLSEFPEECYITGEMSTDSLWEISTTLDEAGWIMKHREDYSLLPCAVFYNSFEKQYSYQYRLSHREMKQIDNALYIPNGEINQQIATIYFEFPDGNLLRPQIRDITVHNPAVSISIRGWLKKLALKLPIRILRPYVQKPPSLQEYTVGESEQVFAVNETHAERLTEMSNSNTID